MSANIVRGWSRFAASGIWFAFAFTWAQAGGAQSIGEPTTAAVSGVVIHAETGEPLEGTAMDLIRVGPPGVPGGVAQPGALMPTAGPRHFNRTVRTDDAGRFQFEGVEAGTYRLFARRNGFARQEYGRQSFNRPGVAIHLDDGEHAIDLTFRLTPAGVIHGRVTDADGTPLTGIKVEALRSAYDATGHHWLQSAGAARTDDLGEYRIYWINPGRYLLSAHAEWTTTETMGYIASVYATMPEVTAQEGAAQMISMMDSMFGPGVALNEVHPQEFVRTYYPNFTDVSQATPIDVQPAETRVVDFALTRTPLFRLAGVVVDAATGGPPPTAVVTLTPRNPTGLRPPAASDGLLESSGHLYHPATGEFLVEHVPGGDYWLRVVVLRPPVPPVPGGIGLSGPPTPSFFTGRIPVDVREADMSGLTVTVTPAVSVTGRVSIDGIPPTGAIGPGLIGVSLQPTSSVTPAAPMLQGGVFRPGPDGAFTIPLLFPDTYRLSAFGLPPFIYLKEARHGQTDVLEEGLAVGDTFSGTLDIVLGVDVRGVAGRVVDAAGAPVAGVQAVLIPDRATNRSNLHRAAVTDRNGGFVIVGVPPGNYRIFAWEDIDFFSYFDPEVITRYESQGSPVSVQESSSEAVEVRLIPADIP